MPDWLIALFVSQTTLIVSTILNVLVNHFKGQKCMDKDKLKKKMVEDFKDKYQEATIQEVTEKVIELTDATARQITNQVANEKVKS